MTQPLVLCLSLIWGALVGLGFFGGLWLTVRALPKSARPHLLWSGSFAARLALLCAGFALLLRFGALATLMGACGLLLTRLALTRRLAPDVVGRMPMQAQRRQP